MEDYYLKDKTYKIIGICMEVHKILGKGHSEKVYSDAIEYELKSNEVQYERESKFIFIIKKLFCQVTILLIF